MREHGPTLSLRDMGWGNRVEEGRVDWSDEARDIIEDLVQELPLPVRDGVRQAAQFRAESIAEEKSAGKVKLETAVQAFIEATPADLRERLKHTLSYKGIDPDEYEAAFFR